MTPEEHFKSNAASRDGLREFLDSDIGKAAVSILKDKHSPRTLPEVASLLPSERMHLYAQNQTFQAGWHECLRALAALTLPNAEQASRPQQPTLKRDFPKQPTA